ncbi:unnamed protein product, partial [Brassica rapa subsp. trilocularis]
LRFTFRSSFRNSKQSFPGGYNAERRFNCLRMICVPANE